MSSLLGTSCVLKLPYSSDVSVTELPFGFIMPCSFVGESSFVCVAGTFSPLLLRQYTAPSIMSINASPPTEVPIAIPVTGADVEIGCPDAIVSETAVVVDDPLGVA